MSLQEDLLHRCFYSEACINCVECSSMKHEKIYNYRLNKEPFEHLPKNKRLWHKSTCMYDEKRYKLLFEAYIIKSICNKIILFY